MASGAAKLAEPVAKSLFKIDVVKKALAKAPLPFVIEYREMTEVGGKKFANELVAKSLEKAASKGLELGAKKLIAKAASYGTQSADNGATNSQGPLIQDATLSSKLLLYLGIVNMEKGIGRGW